VRPPPTCSGRILPAGNVLVVRPILVGAVVLGVLLSSCIDDFEQAAVTAPPGGGLRVLYYPCRTDRPAETVQLLVDDGDTPGNGNDTVLWKATAGDRPIVASDVMTFEPANVPTGYSETVTLDAPEPGRDVLVYITVRGGGSFVAGFSWGSLDDGSLLTQAGTNTATGWLRYAREGCGHG
jgi:hypothetical protein